ncbi:hypothetical protein FJY63_11720, partial [Candidatus Sumerlaeota bacterium]|nr:hypothetical protein [Candidatus Sumerlaeota bacterium]
EKWSDFALLSSLCRQEHFPPSDPWFAGLPINYYYFGHMAWATMAKLTAIPPNIAYNLALATIVALALVLCTSLGYHLFRSVGLGLLLAWLVVLGGNVKPLAQLSHNWLNGIRPITHLDYWDASRAMSWGHGALIQGSEINEFPSFSFILGDLHPHFSGHPLLLGFLLIIAVLWRKGQRETFSAHDVLFRRFAQWMALALIGGLLYATNSWDFFVGLFFVAGLLPFARGFRRWPRLGRIALAAFIVVLTYIVAKRVLFLPFDRHFVPPKLLHLKVTQWLPPQGEIGLPLAVVPPQLRSTAIQWLFYFGLFVVPYLMWHLCRGARRLKVVPLDRAVARLAVSLAVGMLFYVHAQNGLVALLSFILVWMAPSAFREHRHDRLGLISILVWLALLISLLCELFYYDDAFGGSDERINTIFKVYYSLWPVTALGALGACSALWGEARTPHVKLRRAVVWLLAALLLAISALYPAFNWTSRVGNYAYLNLERRPTLDGLEYLESLPGYADDYKAALWLRDNAPPDAVVAEAADWGYSAAGRFAALAGVSSVLGWWQHETVWREGFGNEPISSRRKALDDLFTTTSVAAATAILATYQVDCVAVGHLERSRYPRDGLDKFGTIGSKLFQSGETIIYGMGRSQSWRVPPPK